MTEFELNEVRELRLEINELVERLNRLRAKAVHATQIISDMPRAPNVRSKVERTALEAVEVERELTALHERLTLAAERLTARILSEVSEPLLQGLLLMRYVKCLSFKNAARRLRISLRHAYRLHTRFLRQVLASPPSDVL